jgi:hypothetical protein
MAWKGLALERKKATAFGSPWDEINLPFESTTAMEP